MAHRISAASTAAKSSRYFYFIPSKGHGAVDRSRLPKLEAEGTSKLHEFIDIGVEDILQGLVGNHEALDLRHRGGWG